MTGALEPVGDLKSDQTCVTRSSVICRKNPYLIIILLDLDDLGRKPFLGLIQRRVVEAGVDFCHGAPLPPSFRVARFSDFVTRYGRICMESD